MRLVLYIVLTLWFFFIVFCAGYAEITAETNDSYGVFLLVQMVLWLIIVLLCIQRHFSKSPDKKDNDLFD